MKKLHKMSRNDLKSIQGGLGICGAYFPQEPPLPGEPFDCGCSRLFWCPKRGACVFQNMYTPQACDA